MITGYQLANGALVPAPTDHAGILLCISPGRDERQILHERCGVDEHALDSALDPDEVSRVEFYPDHLFLIWKRPEHYSGTAFEVSSFGLQLGQGQLVIISASNSLLTVSGSRQPLTDLMDVLLEMLFSSVHHYLGHLRVIKMIARELQQKFNHSVSNVHLLQMYNLSESLIYYLNALQGNGAVLARLRRHAIAQGLKAETVSILDELIIENEQCYKQAEIYSTVFSGLMDARGNLANNLMNETLRRLTLINVVFLPLNLIASIGGMSEFSMMTAALPWWIAYPLLVLGMLLLGVAMVAVLRRIARYSRSKAMPHPS
ncbi:magnesium transporter CorA family protein [Pseudomonas sp. MAG002Y]|uniref:magnesium transporter CorA family protein n=1 Tax=Pseudomonas sp. MAG002Y TaxID=2678690 RepID=UPI001C60975C|nr:magnesium transporter CorA family protein [Pseudomonas sp. MAG002Y]MBW5416374.1 magnesium transporter CorA family protein [Pseudomonas sp. MAG002Y]